MEADNPALLYANHIDHCGIDFSRMICEKNLGGIVAKHRESRYNARANWRKSKNPGYTQSKQRHELFGKLKRRGKSDR